MKCKSVTHSKIVPAWNSFCVHVFVQVFSHSKAKPPTLPDPDPSKAYFSIWVKNAEKVFQVSGGAMSCTIDTPCSASSSGHLKLVIVQGKETSCLV